MGTIYEKCLSPLIFKGDAEKAHELALSAAVGLSSVPVACRLLARCTHFNPKKVEPVELFGLTFPNRIGLAAGFDKNAAAVQAFGALGFGHIEVGTVTNEAQPGNPRPRLFRYPQQQAVINRMGFNNAGAKALAERLAKLPHPSKRRIPVGVNIGKTKTVPIDQATNDYLNTYKRIADYANYITLNVSSPNTPGLRKLQGQDHLPQLLKAFMDAVNERARKLGKPATPVLLKIAPDLSYAELDALLETALAHGLSGMILTNTTLSRPGTAAGLSETGGLSGDPLRARSLRFVNYVHRATGGRFPIIGVGGIATAKHAGEFYDAGASLLQVYTGLVYKGPFLARDLAKSLIWTQTSF